MERSDDKRIKERNRKRESEEDGKDKPNEKGREER